MLINYFDLKAVYICTVFCFFLQDVLGAQQTLLQNLINYTGNFNTTMLDRVSALEVSSPYFVTVSFSFSTTCAVLDRCITFYIVYSNSDITSSKMSYTNSFFFSDVRNYL